MVITKECLSFAFVGNDEEIDRVPLDGVDFVKNQDENISVEANATQSQNYFCFQVATNPMGHNSGRSYMLRSKSRSARDEILLLLSKLSKEARQRAEARTGFQKLQLKVKKYYERDFCQSVIALVIMAVIVQHCHWFHLVVSLQTVSCVAELLLHHYGGTVSESHRKC